MILLFTANQPRHAALARALAGRDELIVMSEPKSLGPFETGTTLARYWQSVRDAERTIFGADLPVLSGRVVSVRPGEVSQLDLGVYIERVSHVVVFSSSYLKPPLIDQLIARSALNLHVGIAPEYRGSAPNFWAEYDGRPDLVGAQVQRLSPTLDAGEILAEVRVGATDEPDPFLRGMLACREGIKALIDLLDRPVPWTPVRTNDPGKGLRYARYSDFTPEVVEAYLARFGR